LITHQNTAIDKASIEIIGTDYTNQTDSLGSYIFRNVPQGNYKIEVSTVGFKTQRKNISIQTAKQIQLNFELQTEDNELNEVVV
jgi:outer membrane receptor for ferrienterochelin and colicins